MVVAKSTCARRETEKTGARNKRSILFYYTQMNIPRKLALLTVLGVSLFAAETRWLRLKSPSFEMYSSASDRNARETLKYFEQVHAFFAQAMGALPGTVLPVRIIGFSSKKEYDPYSPNNAAIAYYQGTPRIDYIVLSQTGPEVFPVAVHEYVHLVTRHAGLKLPPWLNEGLAEFYSTLKPLGDKIVLGDLIVGRYRALLHEKWVPLSVIVKADHNSPFYNEKSQAGSLYNEGWALVHMLVLKDEYRSGFSKFLRESSAGTPTEEALLKVYGKSVDQVDHELDAYLHGSQFKAVVVPQKLEKAADEFSVEPASPFDVKLALADLLNRPAKEQEMRTMLEQLTVEDAKRPEPYVGLGYIAWRQKQNEDAEKDFAKAFDLGDREPSFLTDYARLTRGRNNADSIRALTALIALEPEKLDVRMDLAAVYLISKKPDAALAVLPPVTKVSKEEAPRFFTIKAHAQLDDGLFDDARKSAGNLARFATTDDEKSQAQQILKYLDSRNGGPPPALTESPSPGQSMQGSFLELNCSQKPPRAVIETAEGKKLFLIDGPYKIVGGASGLNCGPQKKATVKVGFAPSDQSGIDGLLRTIQFEP